MRERRPSRETARTIGSDDALTLEALVAEVEAILTPAVGRFDFDDARREARDLVTAMLEHPRFWASLYPALPVSEDVRLKALNGARRRARGAPFGYAAGRVGFRHLTLVVDERVLIPRPETEQLVELALALAGEGGVVADVGTGSGAIAIALATEGRFERVVGTDLSTDALAVAAENIQRHADRLRAPVELRSGSLLDPLGGERLNCVVSNPPYIAHHEAGALPLGVRNWEPAVALFSAPDGLALTAQLVRQAGQLLESRGALVLEVDARRASLVAELIATDDRFHQIAVSLDVFGRERFVSARRR